MSFIKLFLQACFVLIMVVSLFHWIRVRFWVPKYIHYLAKCAFIAGAITLYSTIHSLDLTDKHKALSLVTFLGFPVAVYLIFGLYGGGIHSKDITLNRYFIVDRAMDKEEAIELFMEYLKPYQSWRYEDLLILSTRNRSFEVSARSGKRYTFELSVSRIDEAGDIDTNEGLVAVYGLLTAEGNKFYKPKARASFLLAKNGDIFADGLSMQGSS